MEFDIIIKNGFIIDGTGSPWYRADIGIKEGRISEVKREMSASQSNADKVINASGHVVCPGFIDMHSHSEYTYFTYPEAENKLKQGITTEVNGHCGMSAAPIIGDGKSYVTYLMNFLSKITMDIDWITFKDFFDKIEQNGGISINAAFLVGFGTVRTGVMGYEKGPPTREQVEKMQELVRSTMEDGVFGFTSGLQYPVQNYAETEEVVSLAKVAAEYGGIYTSHIRRRGWTGDEKYGRAFLKPMQDTFPEAIKECIEIGERAGIPVVWSHAKNIGGWGPNKGRIREFLKIVEDARKRGVDITLDTMENIFTGVGIEKILPTWLWDVDESKTTQNLIKVLNDPQLRKKVIPFIENAIGEGCELNYDEQILTKITSRKYEKYIGKKFSEIRETEGKKSNFELIFDMFVRGKDADLIGPWGTQEDLTEIVKHPLTNFGTDSDLGKHADQTGIGHGIYKGTGYGLYPRILRKYVREQGVISFEEAIRKMCSSAANTIGLFDRGIIKPGLWADIVIFDPISVKERTMQPPDGIPYVIVNGELTIKNGEHTGARAGKILKRD